MSAVQRSGDERFALFPLMSQVHYWVASALDPAATAQDRVRKLPDAQDLITDLNQLASAAKKESGVGPLALTAARWLRIVMDLLTGQRRESLCRALVEEAERGELPNDLDVPLNLILSCPGILNAVEEFEASAKVVTRLVERPELDNEVYGAHILLAVLLAVEETETARRLGGDTIRRALERARLLPEGLRETLIARLTPHLAE